MKAAYINGYGGPEVLEYGELPTPEPGAGEVRVAVRACGLNHLDLWVRGGMPNLKLPLPHVCGGDVAGVVDAVGDEVSTVEPGARVVLSPGVSCRTCRACLSGRHNLCRHYGILGEHRWGGNADAIVVPAANVAPLPENLSFVDAAALPVTFTTAWQMVVHKARVMPGQTVLVQGASSGVGVALVQIARLFGATVFATASTEAKRAAALELGAAQAFDSTAPDLAKQVKRACVGGVDAVFEHIGIATWDQSVRALRFEGRLVTCGATTGYDARIDLRVLFWKQLELLGSTMGGMGDFLAALDAVASGKLRAVVDRTFPMAETRAAHEYLEARQQFGKVVLLNGERGSSGR